MSEISFLMYDKIGEKKKHVISCGACINTFYIYDERNGLVLWYMLKNMVSLVYVLI